MVMAGVGIYGLEGPYLHHIYKCAVLGHQGVR